MTQQLIQTALDNTPAAHKSTLFGERRAGSQWGRDFTLADWVALLPRWEPINPAPQACLPGCTYYTSLIGDMFAGATLGAVAWQDVPETLQGQVQVFSDAHGPSLGLRNGLARPRADTATLILGPDAGQQVVYTLHPGAVLLPGIERNGLTAVKLLG